MKYKELPAFETNEFKVGDHVRLYGVSGSFDGTITTVGKELIVIRGDVQLTGHFKQFRKLEEVTPREYIRYIDEFGNLYKSGESYYFNGTEFMITEPTKRIKLREVLEE